MVRRARRWTGQEARFSFDAPIHSWADVEACRGASRPGRRFARFLNIKPSRFGSLRALLDCVARAQAAGIVLYGGGQFELGVGRDHIQALASLFYADGPNDVAPRDFHGEPRPARRGARSRRSSSTRASASPSRGSLPAAFVPAARRAVSSAQDPELSGRRRDGGRTDPHQRRRVHGRPRRARGTRPWRSPTGASRPSGRPRRSASSRVPRPAWSTSAAAFFSRGSSTPTCTPRRRSRTSSRSRSPACASVRECVDAVAGFAAERPELPFIRGFGWSDSYVPRLGPAAADLDAVVPDRPVILHDDSYHSVWLNSAGLQLAGIDGSTPDPDNGVIERLEDGSPSGTLARGSRLCGRRGLPRRTRRRRRARASATSCARWPARTV